jgi:Ca-activated chloride channel homolog
VNSIPEGGTDLADAINTAVSAFKENDAHKVLVLLTDGEDNVNESAALAAAQNAAKAGLKIFTIGIGTAEGDLIRITDADGNSDYVRDANGNVVKSHLDEPLLKQIAAVTGGFYLPLRGADTMSVLYQRGLAPLPKTESAEKLIRRYHEQFYWPLAAAILLLLAELFLPERKKSRSEKPKAKIEATTMMALVGILLLPAAVKASPAGALRDYNSGDFTNALAEYEQLAQIHTNDLRFIFNAGAAAYRATNFDEALSDFQTAAAAPDLKLQQQAYYNLGNTLYRLGEQKFEPDTTGLNAMEQTWQQALKCYAHAAELNTNDADAAFNLNFVKRQLALIKQLQEAMRRAKSEADEAVRLNEYHRALEIMENLMQNKIAAKKFQDYVNKLKNIDAIVTPHQR